MKLNEVAPVQINQPKLWHMTEAANLKGVEQEGFLFPKREMRGAGYQDNRLHFFTTLEKHAIEEIEQVVRFGGVDFDDEERMNERADVPLVIVELDMKELAEFDEQMEHDRKWFRDDGVTADVGVWTNVIVPADALRVYKTM